MCPGSLTATGPVAAAGILRRCARADVVRTGESIRRLDRNTRRPSLTKSSEPPRPTGRCAPADLPRLLLRRRVTHIAAQTLKSRIAKAIKLSAITTLPRPPRSPESATLSGEDSTLGSGYARLTIADGSLSPAARRPVRAVVVHVSRNNGVR